MDSHARLRRGTHAALRGGAWIALLATAAVACGNDTAPSAPTPSVATTTQPIWVNGDFENDNQDESPTGWTVSTFLNVGVAGSAAAPPNTLAQLQQQAGGEAQTIVVAGAAESQPDPSMGTGATLRFPKYGNRAARVNDGANNNGNQMTQTMTTTVGDVDPTDGKVHVRFAIAPVLQNPGHSFNEQPYYFVQLENLTTNTTLYSDFNVSNQAGVPWKTPDGGNTLYTDWQLVDIAPGDAGLAVGNQVRLTVVAAGCSQGGHSGRVYVDAVGSGIPGLYSWATGPQAANAGDVISYSVNYKNGGTTTTSGTYVDFTTPPNTTFDSAVGGNCTGLAAGATGTTRCSLASLAPGATGSFLVKVKINGNATGTITNGTYSIAATGVSALIGPKVYTTVTTNTVYADIGVTKTDGKAAVVFGAPNTYTIVATNNATTGAGVGVTVTDTMPTQLTGVTWTCTASAGSACGAATGSGNIADNGLMLPGGTRTYVVSATIETGTGTSSVTNRATVAITTGGVVDPVSQNNTAVDTDSIGTLRNVVVTKIGAPAGGTITSTPTAISCGTACSSATGSFLEGSQIVLTAAPSAGFSFQGWTGDCLSAGTSPTCNVTVSADLAVSARFVGAPSQIAVSSGGGQSTAVNTSFTSALQAVVRDAANQPVPGVTVAFAAPTTGASATSLSASAVTDANGLATTSIPRANTVTGAYAVTATTAGAAVPASFALTNVAGPVAQVTASAGASPQTTRVGTAFTNALEVTLTDAFGNLVPGATVNYTVGTTGARATLGAPSAVSDANGKASITATAGTIAGQYTVTATSNGVTETFTLRNSAGNPAKIAAISGGAQSTTVATPFTSPLVVEVRDANDNLVDGAVVTFSSPATGASASFTQATGTTGTNGRTNVTASANNVAGAYSVEATVTGGQGPVQFALTNTAGAAVRIEASQTSTPQSATAGTAFGQPLTFTAFDQYDNPVPGVVVGVSVPAGPVTGVPAAATATTGADGSASVAIDAGTVAGTFTATVTLPGGAQATFSLTNLAGAPSQVSVSAGTSQSATVRTAFAAPLVVLVQDANGNPVEGAAVDFTTPNDGASATLAATTVNTNAQGLASVAATANEKSGTYEVNASAQGGGAPVTFTLTNTAGAIAAVTADPTTTPQSAKVNTQFALPLAVVVTDADNNPVPGVVVTFVAPAAALGATLASTTATTDANGIATVEATAASAAGTYAVTATAAGSELAATFQLANLSGDPSELRIVSGGSQTTLATTAFAAPIVVILEDANDNPVPNTALAVAVPLDGASATVDPAVVTTGADGQATLTLTANAVSGEYVVALSAVGGLAPLALSLTNVAIPTTATLATAAAEAGSAVTLSATVASEVSVPNGPVALFEGAQQLGSAELVNGVAAITVTFAQPGSHELVAVYAARDPWAESRSEVVTLVVSAKPNPGENDGGTSSGGSSSGNAGDGGTSSGGTSGASGNASSSGSSGASGSNGADPYLGLGGGSGCSATGTGFGDFGAGLMGLAAVVFATRRRKRA